MLPAHQLQGELAIPVPEYGHPHATNNGECSRDAPGPTNSLPLHLRGGGRAAPSPLLWASARFRRRARKRVTGMARPCAHNAARPHLQQCDRGVDGPGAGDDGPTAAGGGGTCCLRTSCRSS
jgi:hypothetical protein